MADLSDLASGPLALAAMLAAVTVLSVGAGLVSAERRRRSQAASLGAIDFVRASFASRLARGDPMDELLAQVVEALRNSLKLDSAQVWVHEAGVLHLLVSAPPAERSEIAVSQEEQAIAARARVSGQAWARVWLPALLDKEDSVPLRLAPLEASGELLGLVVVERRQRGERLAADADLVLEELAREVGAGLHRMRLDSSLHASLERLREQASELQASRARIVAAADAERRRMERDLHDGAQQHLVAIAVKVRLIQRLAPTDNAQATALTEEVLADVEAALVELRTLAHGLYPPLLSGDGLSAALGAVCRRAPVQAQFRAEGVGRYPPEIEAAVYYSCLEALQNVAKHAGEGASARVKVWEEGGCICFEVGDNGAGFDLESQARGAGLTNMSDRMGAVGGTLRVASDPRSGTRVLGAVPLIEGRSST